MLTTFYFDSELFFEDILEKIPAMNDIILNKWRLYGCLGICPEEQSEILKSLSRVHPKYVTKWKLAFSNNECFRRTELKLLNQKLSNFNSYDEIKSCFIDEEILTGLLHEDYLELFNDFNNENFELISPSHVNESKFFNKSEELSKLDISKKDSIDDIWFSRFKNLSKFTKRIIIIDRYAAKNIMEDHSNKKVSSIDKFIKFLSFNKKKYSIELYSSFGEGNNCVNLEKLKKYISEELKIKSYCKGIKLKISLCKSSDFSDHAHDRMLRFENHIVQIGNGLDIFRCKKMKNNTFNIKELRTTKFNDIHSELNRNKKYEYKF